MFITFEGIDGSGKTTQINLLKNWFEKKGYDVLITSEPTNEEVGKILRKRLKEKTHGWVEALLFAADRALHCEKTINPNLNKIVICDRYVHSSLAYQSAEGVDKEWIKCLNKMFPEPDIIIYIDIKPETAMKRIKSRKKETEKYEQENFLRKVRENYLSMKGGKFKVINGEKTVEDVHKEIISLVTQQLFK